MKVQLDDRAKKVMSHIYADKGRGMQFSIQEVHPGIRVKVMDLTKRYKLPCIQLSGNRYVWTWIGGKRWYYARSKTTSFPKSKVILEYLKGIREMIPELSDSSAITFANPKVTATFSRDLNMSWELTNPVEVENRIFLMLDKIETLKQG